MSAERVLSDELLDPIRPDQPAGESLRWLPEWDRIKEARQSDDSLPKGKWARRDAKSANWRLTRELASAMLRTRSKDLQLAMWLTEANIHLDGFKGLADGLYTSREILSRFWDAGLFPEIEDGPEDRKGPFEWLNGKLTDSVLSIPITCCATLDSDYSLADLRDARLVGSEAQYKDEDGEIDPQKKREYDKAIADGKLSVDMFESAVKDSKRASFEQLFAEFEAASTEFKKLEQVIEEKFGDAAPNLSDFRSALSDIRQEISNILERKRKQEPDAPGGAEAKSESELARDGHSASPQSTTIRFPLFSPSAATRAGTSWQHAEQLVRSGNIDTGLAEMVRLAAAETSGRSRFERKLLLAEACLSTGRERLARAVLEELAEQIETHHLDSWESSELISCVWTRLYQIYKRSGGGSSEEAEKLYGRLCRLDPWQALACGE
jgi:type VI secretion system protein ImpA